MTDALKIVVTTGDGAIPAIIVTAVILVGFWFVLRIRENRFRASVATKHDVRVAVDVVTKSVLDKLPAAINDDLRKQVAALIEQRKQLEQARDWVLVAVEIPGIRDASWPDRTVYASLYWNVQTGEMKPPEEQYRRLEDKNERMREAIGPALITGFRAPSFRKLDETSIIMLDVVYKTKR